MSRKLLDSSMLFAVAAVIAIVGCSGANDLPLPRDDERPPTDAPSAADGVPDAPPKPPAATEGAKKPEDATKPDDASQPNAGKTSPTLAWEVTEGLAAPESVYHHAATQTLFVSQIGAGGPDGKDGDGVISKFSLDGKPVDLAWFKGLNAPKGLRSHGGVLYVADIDRLVGVEIASGQVKVDHAIEGAKFLNDVACGPDGAVYVSDTIGGKVHRFFDGKSEVLLEGDAAEHPNGLLVEGGRLLIGGWGLEIGEGFVTKTPGRLLALDLATKTVTSISKAPLGNLDGLELDSAEGYIVSDWMNGKVYRVSALGEAKVLAELKQGAADLAFVADQRLLIVPQMMENKLLAFKLE